MATNPHTLAITAKNLSIKQRVQSVKNSKQAKETSLQFYIYLPFSKSMTSLFGTCRMQQLRKI